MDDLASMSSSPGAILHLLEHYDRPCFLSNTSLTSQIGLPRHSTRPCPVQDERTSGAGKSAIVPTCAEKLAENGHLEAAFFLTVNEHNNSLRSFTTIAYQLTTTLPDYCAALQQKIFNDNTIFEKKIRSQFGSLIVEPLQELEEQGKIKIIASFVREGSTLFHWAIFSRAEPRIVSTLKSMSIGGSGSLENKVKFKQRVQWARRTVWLRRNDYRRWLGKQFNDCPLGFLKIPFTDKAETNPTLSIYSRQIQFGPTSKFQYHSSRIPY